MKTAVVAAVWASATHSFSRFPQAEQAVIAGQGVAGDAHCGVAVSLPLLPHARLERV